MSPRKSTVLSALVYVYFGLSNTCSGKNLRSHTLEAPTKRKLACERTTALLTSGDYIYTNQNPWTTKPTGTDATTFIKQQNDGRVAVYTRDKVRGSRKICETPYEGASGKFWTKLQGDGNFITYSGSYDNTSNKVWKSNATGAPGKYFLGVKCDDTVVIYREGFPDLPLWTCPLVLGDEVYAYVRGSGNVTADYGMVKFQYPTNATGYTRVTYNFVGLPPNKLLGMHVHTGPVGPGNNCDANSTLGHWNPGNKNHGSNLDELRHVGDMGNILTDESGTAVGSLLAAVQPLGEDGILGRSVVVHGGTDDLGLGGNDGSRASGNAGARIACGIVQSNMSA